MHQAEAGDTLELVDVQLKTKKMKFCEKKILSEILWKLNLVESREVPFRQLDMLIIGFSTIHKKDNNIVTQKHG